MKCAAESRFSKPVFCTFLSFVAADFRGRGGDDTRREPMRAEGCIHVASCMLGHCEFYGKTPASIPILAA